MEGVIPKGGRNIVEQDLLSLCIELHALGRVDRLVSFIHQSIELGVVITRAGCEGGVRAPVYAQPVLRIRVVCTPTTTGKEWEGVRILLKSSRGGGIDRIE